MSLCSFYYYYFFNGLHREKKIKRIQEHKENQTYKNSSKKRDSNQVWCYLETEAAWNLTKSKHYHGPPGKNLWISSCVVMFLCSCHPLYFLENWQKVLCSQEASSAVPLFSPVLVPMAQSMGPLLSQIASSPTFRLGVRYFIFLWS